MIYLRMLCLVIVMTVISTACGNSDTGDDAVPTRVSVSEQNTNDTDSTEQQSAPSTGALPSYDLAENAYTLNISGAISGGSGYTEANNEVLRYGPYGSGTNSEGAMFVRMRWDGVTYNSTSYDVNVYLVLREGITSGTHPIGDSVWDDSTNVSGHVDFFTLGVVDFEENVSGSLTLDSANREYANGTFEFDAENEDGESVTVSGAFHLVPFSREVDSDLNISGAVDENFSHNTSTSWNVLQEDGIYDIHFIFTALPLILKLPSDINVGTYEINAESAVSAEWSYSFPAFGTLELTEAGDYYSGSLNLNTTTDDGDVMITGTFEAIPSGTNED